MPSPTLSDDHLHDLSAMRREALAKVRLLSMTQLPLEGQGAALQRSSDLVDSCLYAIERVAAQTGAIVESTQVCVGDQRVEATIYLTLAGKPMRMIVHAKPGAGIARQFCAQLLRLLSPKKQDLW